MLDKRCTQSKSEHLYRHNAEEHHHHPFRYQRREVFRILQLKLESSLSAPYICDICILETASYVGLWRDKAKLLSYIAWDVQTLHCSVRLEMDRLFQWCNAFAWHSNRFTFVVLFFFFLFAGGKDQMCLSKPSSCEYITHNFLCFLQLENVSWETVQQEISNSQLLLLQFCIITATIKEPIKKLKRSLRTDFLFFHFHLCVCFGQIARRVKTLTKTRPGENRCRLLKMMTLYELSKTGCQWPAMLFSFIWLVKGNKMTELIKSDHKDGVERPEATSTDSHPRV